MRKRTAIAVVLVLLALALPFWPSGLGGSTTYLVTAGASMKPRFSSGDLAILRTRSSYDVGDIAAYRSAELHRVVLHRIVATTGSTYTFKGDANSFRDPEPVARSQIVGTLWLRIPRLGAALLWLLHPFNALLLMLLGAVVIWDRHRLAAYLKGRPLPAAPVAAPAPAPVPAADRPELRTARVVPIADLKFPHELAIADVVDEAALLRLAEHYDRPVLYDEDSALLFVVESSMLFRCRVSGTVNVPALSVVRPLVPDAVDVAPEPVVAVAPEPEPVVAVEPEPAPEPVAPAQPEPQPEPVPVIPAQLEPEVVIPTPTRSPAPPAARRPGRHRQPGRRVPNPFGRDWAYDRRAAAPPSPELRDAR